jgi:hypothetical protein
MNNNAKLDHIPRDESIGVKRSESSVEKLDIFHVKGQPERCCDVALELWSARLLQMSTVYVGNLDHEATVADLHEEFDRYGRIRDLWVAKQPPGHIFFCLSVFLSVSLCPFPPLSD